jgi:glutathione synthase/RimK-type ligase-like ATP-grasp enzyme
MILTATPFLWEQMFHAPLEQRFGPAPDELIDFAAQAGYAALSPAMPDQDCSAALQAALAALPAALQQKLAPRLLGIFFVNGDCPALVELIAGQDREPVGAVLLLDLRAIAGAAPQQRVAASQSLLLQALDAARHAWLAEPAGAFPRIASRSAATQACLDLIAQPGLPFLGLAPFARLSAADGDMRAAAQALLELAQREEHNPALWMNLSTAFFAMGQRELGLTMQSQALQAQRLYALPTARQPASLRLLLLMAAGDLAENTPLDCLLEHSDVELLLYYASADAPLPAVLPEHDILQVAISDTKANRPLLRALEPLLAQWEKPVLNLPQHIPHTERSAASALLQRAPGIAMPPTREAARETLQAIACAPAQAGTIFDGCAFPLIVRPVGSHAGRDLERIADGAELAAYLERVADAAFYVSRFIDYSGADGLFRKMRIALIAGQPFVCHMAVSSHWMIHYVNAGMYQDAAKRAEEAAFMQRFDDFARRHRAALDAIVRRSQLDYVCIDCAETRDGELLVFEIDHAMVAHAMDPEHLFPYKQAPMRAVRQAYERMLHAAALAAAGAVQ